LHPVTPKITADADSNVNTDFNANANEHPFGQPATLTALGFEEQVELPAFSINDNTGTNTDFDYTAVDWKNFTPNLSLSDFGSITDRAQLQSVMTSTPGFGTHVLSRQMLYGHQPSNYAHSGGQLNSNQLLPTHMMPSLSVQGYLGTSGSQPTSNTNPVNNFMPIEGLQSSVHTRTPSLGTLFLSSWANCQTPGHSHTTSLSSQVVLDALHFNARSMTSMTRLQPSAYSGATYSSMQEASDTNTLDIPNPSAQSGTDSQPSTGTNTPEPRNLSAHPAQGGRVPCTKQIHANVAAHYANQRKRQLPRNGQQVVEEETVTCPKSKTCKSAIHSHDLSRVQQALVPVIRKAVGYYLITDDAFPLQFQHIMNKAVDYAQSVWPTGPLEVIVDNDFTRHISTSSYLLSIHF
jgi:hypothetical protein